ncbi:MAG TPA: penicillin-binding protein 2 [Anaerolineae bacterium]
MISTRRLVLLALILMVPIVMVLLRTTQIQVTEGASYSEQALDQQVRRINEPAPRGTIYDRNGNILAVTQRSFLIRIDTNYISETSSVAAAVGSIAPVISRPPAEVEQRINAIVADSRKITRTLPTMIYSGLKPEIGDQLTKALTRSVLYNGVRIEPMWSRVYPQGPLAGPIVGFVTMQPKGVSGIEGYYDRELNGQDGVRIVREPYDLITVTPTIPSSNLVLSINSILQSYVEKRLAQGVAEYKANGGTIIVMETRTGAILASASTPGYDPNLAMDVVGTDAAKRLHDPGVADLYEPGSVMKLLTTATALDAGVITTHSTYMDSGAYIVGGRMIRNSDNAGHGRVDILYFLQHSLNVVAAQIAADIGPEKFYARLKMFGIGRKSGVDVQNEAIGQMRTPADSDWTKLDMAENSFGQSLSATPLQVLNAINAIANDGVLMQPYFVQQWQQPDGQVVNKRPVMIQRVVSAEAARQLKLVIAEATRTATPKALPKGYTAAGKTGTATWYLRGIPQKTTIVTYVGWLPAQQPLITVLTKFDQPQTDQFAAKTALPVFHDVAERAAQILGIPPDVIQSADTK